MNKTSGKLAAGVRKVRTPPKAPVAVDKALTAPAAPARSADSSRAALPDPHPARIWPD